MKLKPTICPDMSGRAADWRPECTDVTNLVKLECLPHTVPGEVLETDPQQAGFYCTPEP